MIVEYSNCYNKELLDKETEEDQEFMKMINQNNGTNILSRIHAEQLKIFENCVKFDYPLKYFINIIDDFQLEAFEKQISDDHEDLIRGIEKIEEVEIFKFLDLGIPAEYFENRELETIKKDCIATIQDLTLEEAREVRRRNPALVSDEAMDSLLHHIDSSEEMSRQMEFSTHKEGEIFFEDQNSYNRPSSYRVQEHFENKILVDSANSQIRLPNGFTGESNGSKVVKSHPLMKGDSKGMSSIDRFTVSENDFQAEKSFEGIINELSGIYKGDEVN